LAKSFAGTKRLENLGRSLFVGPARESVDLVLIVTSFERATISLKVLRQFAPVASFLSKAM
jgi:hypothetical protein